MVAVSDNGPGMSRYGIENLLAVGYVKNDTAHEHGVGMKVVSYFGGGALATAHITSTTTTETFDMATKETT